VNICELERGFAWQGDLAREVIHELRDVYFFNPPSFGVLSLMR